MKKQIENLGKKLNREELKNINGALSRLEYCERVCSGFGSYPYRAYLMCGCLELY
ncbi:bacteriocin-like protein [Tenacibaculum amylolyticum]|uniref:bacteriocin-like protein n=1 Tax=Tenacibaculum amylolyticum TaxID=104269 RepID=UPI0038B50BB3